MNVRHRISFSLDKVKVAALDAAEVSYKIVGTDFSSGQVSINISENSEQWTLVRRMMDQWTHYCDICWTEFSMSELRAASWLAIASDWHHGYPMPDRDFGYLRATYDLGAYCGDCGVGARQKAPFRLRGEPKWGKRCILQLNWVFDELFVAPRVFETVFAPLGFDCWPVLSHRTGRELRTAVQLRFETILQGALNIGDHPFAICRTCRRKKFLPFVRGFFPALKEPGTGIREAKSSEWFGSGASAHRTCFVSQDVYTALTTANVRGGWFHPVAELA